jgi:16S rRNA processing protein RimM
MQKQVKDKLISIGQIIKPHGVRGELKVELWFLGGLKLTDFIGQEVYLKDPEKALVVETARWNNKVALIKFKGINSPEEADLLRQRELFFVHEQMGDLPDNEFFVEDLIGLEVIDQETSAVIGTVFECNNIPGNPLLKIKLEDGKLFLLPLAAEFIKEVNIKDSKVIVLNWKPFASL